MPRIRFVGGSALASLCARRFFVWDLDEGIGCGSSMLGRCITGPGTLAARCWVRLDDPAAFVIGRASTSVVLALPVFALLEAATFVVARSDGAGTAPRSLSPAFLPSPRSLLLTSLTNALPLGCAPGPALAAAMACVVGLATAVWLSEKR